MTTFQLSNVSTTALSLFETSRQMFWLFLPAAFLLAILMIYVSGEISGARFESLFRRLLIAIMLLVAFPQISNTLVGLESYLTNAFGGEQTLTDIFSRVSDRVKEVKDAGSVSWLQVGKLSLTIISTVSFLILSIVQRFLGVLHVVVWNLLHILGPLALLGCLFPTWSNVPKGIFIGMLELALWKPVWVILGRIFVAIGFGTTPPDPSQWLDAAIMNFAVAGLMACTPALVHGFLSGALASIGGSAVQTMLSGTGGALATLPIKTLSSAAQAPMRAIKDTISKRPSIRPSPNSKFRNQSQPKPNLKPPSQKK